MWIFSSVLIIHTLEWLVRSKKVVNICSMANSRLRKLGNYLRPYWRMVLLGTIALLIVNGLGVYIPLLGNLVIYLCFP